MELAGWAEIYRFSIAGHWFVNRKARAAGECSFKFRHLHYNQHDIQSGINAGPQILKIQDKNMGKGQWLRLTIYGFLIWLIPFAVAFLVFSYRQTNRPLFESIMPVTLTLVVMAFCVLYFRKFRPEGFSAGLLVGFVWMAISLVLDAPMFWGGPMQMSLAEYAADIALTYAIILIIPAGCALLRWPRASPG